MSSSRVEGEGEGEGEGGGKRRRGGHLDVYMMDDIAALGYLNHHPMSSSSSSSSVAAAALGGRRRIGRRRLGDDDDDDGHPHHVGGDGGHDDVENDEDDDNDEEYHRRPRGVPTRLRLMTVDVPDFKRLAFDGYGTCELPSEIFPPPAAYDGKRRKNGPISFVDGVAPPRPMDHRATGGGSRATGGPIVQKSLARQLYYCYDRDHYRHHRNYHRRRRRRRRSIDQTMTEEEASEPTIGVEILEMSVMNLNPNNIRRIYTSSNKGRWKNVVAHGGGTEVAISSASVGVADIVEGGTLADADDAEEEEVVMIEGGGMKGKTVVVVGGGGKGGGLGGGLGGGRPSEAMAAMAAMATSEEEDDVVDDPNYERNHPVNQYAWLEEMRLRINGEVPFGMPMERANAISRWMYGNAYRQSIPSSPSGGGGWWYLRWLWRPWIIGRAGGGRDGVDGEGESALYGVDEGRNFQRGKAVVPNRASNKP
jgi:hypothetical protein